MSLEADRAERIARNQAEFRRLFPDAERQRADQQAAETAARERQQQARLQRRLQRERELPQQLRDRRRQPARAAARKGAEHRHAQLADEAMTVTRRGARQRAAALPASSAADSVRHESAGCDEAPANPPPASASGAGAEGLQALCQAAAGSSASRQAIERLLANACFEPHRQRVVYAAFKEATDGAEDPSPAAFKEWVSMTSVETVTALQLEDGTEVLPAKASWLWRKLQALISGTPTPAPPGIPGVENLPPNSQSFKRKYINIEDENGNVKRAAQRRKTNTEAVCTDKVKAWVQDNRECLERFTVYEMFNDAASTQSLSRLYKKTLALAADLEGLDSSTPSLQEAVAKYIFGKLKHERCNMIDRQTGHSGKFGGDHKGGRKPGSMTIQNKIKLLLGTTAPTELASGASAGGDLQLTAAAVPVQVGPAPAAAGSGSQPLATAAAAPGSAPSLASGPTGGSEVPRAAAAAAPALETCLASPAVAGGGTPPATAAAAPPTAQGGSAPAAAAAPAPPSASARFLPLTERVTEQQYKAVLKRHTNGGRAVLDRHHHGLEFNVVALHNAVVDQGGYVEVMAAKDAGLRWRHAAAAMQLPNFGPNNQFRIASTLQKQYAKIVKPLLDPAEVAAARARAEHAAADGGDSDSDDM